MSEKTGLWARLVAWAKEPSQTVARIESVIAASDETESECKRIAAMPRECSACRFFRKGECHKNPPLPTTQSWHVNFPSVNPTSWCGEWKPKA